MEDALVAGNLDVVVLLVFIVERNVDHILFQIEELRFFKLERLCIFVDIDIVVHVIRIEVVAINIYIFCIESQSDGGRRIVVAWCGRTVVEFGSRGLSGLLLVGSQHDTFITFKVVFGKVGSTALAHDNLEDFVGGQRSFGCIDGEFETIGHGFVVSESGSISMVFRLVAGIAHEIRLDGCAEVLVGRQHILVALLGEFHPDVGEFSTFEYSLQVDVVATNGGIDDSR